MNRKTKQSSLKSRVAFVFQRPQKGVQKFWEKHRPKPKNNKRQKGRTGEHSPFLNTTRSQAPKAEKKQLSFSFFLPVFVALIAFFIPVAGVKAYDYVMQSPYFNVETIVVEQRYAYPLTQARQKDDRFFSKDELRQLLLADGPLHSLQYDTDEARKTLLEHPWVRWVNIKKELPKTLLLEVVRRAPLAYLSLSPSEDSQKASPLLMVDELGQPFEELLGGAPYDLPVITGVPYERLFPGENESLDRTIRTELYQDLKAALNLIELWKIEGLKARYPIDEIAFLPGGGYSILVAVQDGYGSPFEPMGYTHIVLGKGPYTNKFLRAEFILEYLYQRDKVAEYILLDQPKNAHADIRAVVKVDLSKDELEQLERMETAPSSGKVDQETAPSSGKVDQETAPSHLTNARSENEAPLTINSRN